MRPREPLVLCAHLPRFALVTAAGGHEALAGHPLALVPASAGVQLVQEASGAAEAAGVSAGMTLSEALARCPGLRLLSADPLAVARSWERILRSLEGMGAEVEPSPRAGLVHLDAGALLGLHGGRAGVIAAVRRAVGRPARIGVGPTRFCALAGAHEARAGRARVIERAELRPYLAAAPVRLLSLDAETEGLVEPLERLGVERLGELVALGAGALSDRFGRAGLHAYGLVLGRERGLSPRRAGLDVEETMELSEGPSAQALERVLDVLIARLLARGEGRGRPIRAVTLGARLAAGGTWSERVVFRRALGSREEMALALRLRLALLPAPATSLTLRVEGFGEAMHDQASLFEAARAERGRRLREAVRQAQALAGPEAALRVQELDAGSLVPERRFVLTPYEPL
ncbi:MAG: hypothetical protein KGJ43_03570 [Acidobacteriota bacterium]|nr:hypothetical protein [Acidobacteriota bacterium]